MLPAKFSVIDGKLRERSQTGRQPISRVSNVQSKVKVQASLENTFLPTVEFGSPQVGMMPSMGIGVNKYFTGLLPNSAIDDAPLIQYYRDMYSFDSVGGSACDLLSAFPFSDYTLGGQSSDVLEIFSNSMSRLNLRQLFPEIALCYLVDGAFIGSLVYDSKVKAFQDVMIHDRASATIIRKPFHTLDPVIRVNSGAVLRQYVESGSPYLQSVLTSFPQGFVNAFLEENTLVDPLSTIYIPRMGTIDMPTASYLRRLLPYYMLEKFVYRGTLIESSKRLRATTHIQVGDETWVPTPEEMQEIRDSFMASELDPLGAWVVTRNGINVADFRQGGDMWKYTDLDLTSQKLRALGISEAFLTAEANYSNSEVAQSVFMETMGAFRSMVTSKVLEKKILPLIAVQHGLYKDESKALQGKDPNSIMSNLANVKNLKVPSVAWHKSLENPDSSVLDTLDKLTEKGVPISLRRWAAAGNQNITMLLAEAEEDAAIREAIAKINPDAAPTEEARVQANLVLRSANAALTKRRKGLLTREFGEEAEAYELTPTGKKKWVYNQKAAHAKANATIAAAQMALADPNVKATALRRAKERLGFTTLKV